MVFCQKKNNILQIKLTIFFFLPCIENKSNVVHCHRVLGQLLPSSIYNEDLQKTKKKSLVIFL